MISVILFELIARDQQVVQATLFCGCSDQKWVPFLHHVQYTVLHVCLLQWHARSVGIVYTTQLYQITVY